MTLVKFNNRPVPGFSGLFNEFFNELPSLNTGYNTAVPVNITETPDAYQLELSAPGRNREDFNVNIENGLLTVSYEKKEETKSEDVKSVRREFAYTSFKRSFTLDEKIDAENIQAKYENGLLKFHLPKKEQAKEVKKQISIQ
ncbi:MAG: Hsp20/alpha crystallin family protein [Williamsia sp.]|nr:Hsp20/alpha crystallin family protein [Williamsia sp.]